MIARAARSLRLRAADAADALGGRRDALTPPRRLSDYVGDSDFRATGDEFRVHFEALAGLRSSDRVLEIGCGIGRMARVLVPVLRPPGSYDGFDVVRSGIEWCAARYGATPAPFRFHHADLRNAVYNPDGAQAAQDYRFPFPDGAFDLVIATSLFTHLLPAAAEHYLAQAARVLAVDGRLFTTWLLIPAGTGLPAPFEPLAGADAVAAVSDPVTPEAAVAYDGDWLRARCAGLGLTIDAVAPGTWTGRPGHSRQDLVIAHRQRASPRAGPGPRRAARRPGSAPGDTP